jgi:serine/threonine-protein kinase
MPLVAGQRIGGYEIVAPIGSGGMGEVYRARDSKLKREVAIKVLPADVASDRERLARFQREAEVLASLNHPHIAHVYGIEANALVMELVEGEDLSQRIARGTIPIDETLSIAKQIAEALEAAHDAGIIHRDLKPANIKVREDGMVKVLDFGLAKAQGSGIGDQRSREVANSPTITTPAMTMRGVILGTAAYMSPEQAKGKAVDRRADIWAFGCVLYEMLTGKRAFRGDDVTDVMAAVVRADPDWTALPAETPPVIRSLLDLCLQKDRAKRASSIGVARLLLDPPAAIAGINAAPAIAAWRRNGLIALAAIAGAVIGASISIPAYRWAMPAPAPAPPTRFTIEPDAVSRTGYGRDIAISHDGSLVAFVNTGGALMLRSLTEAQSKPLNGTDGGRAPFFSPDGSWVGFVDATGTLKKVSTTGAGSVAITPLDGGMRGATWLPDDTIIFATGDPATG